jgi:hypothetical protein
MEISTYEAINSTAVTKKDQVKLIVCCMSKDSKFWNSLPIQYKKLIKEKNEIDFNLMDIQNEMTDHHKMYSTKR